MPPADARGPGTVEPGEEDRDTIVARTLAGICIQLPDGECDLDSHDVCLVCLRALNMRYALHVARSEGRRAAEREAEAGRWADWERSEATYKELMSKWEALAHHCNAKEAKLVAIGRAAAALEPIVAGQGRRGNDRPRAGRFVSLPRVEVQQLLLLATYDTASAPEAGKDEKE